ncbi:MAG: AAA family ATPase, partial [Deltaproteobacteria bacterium]|nr:AAA family ATPase [Deltaproteobacteria bacterium]
MEQNLDTSLGYGAQLFSSMIKNDMVYVDKTRFIHQFLRNISNIVFLCRPRRFGKTLLLTTIKAVLEGKVSLFRDLYIGKKRSISDWTISRVIQLDMSLVDSSPEMVNDSLVNMLQTIASSYAIDIVEKKAGPALTELLNKIYRLPQVAPENLEASKSNLLFDPRVAVLIDEYDAPLLDHLFEPETSLDVQTVFRNFYKHLKASEPVLRFSFITGITQFSETNVFSHMLNIRDISLNSYFSSICGFTKKELKTYFAD